jgi:hypothetical protein
MPNDAASILQAIASSIPPIPAEEAPTVGTFYSARHWGNYPPMPGNMGKAVWKISDEAGGVYLIDDLSTDAMAMSAMNFPVPGDDGSGGNYSNWVTSPAIVYGTNDFWLEIARTNILDESGNPTTAANIIHQPWNVTNGIYSVQYAIDLNSPIAWGTVAVTTQTNIIITNLTNPLGVTNVNNPNGFFRAALVNSTNLVVDKTPTAQQLARMLVPSDVTVTNVTYTGSLDSCGTFTNGLGSGLTIDAGVILSSGPISNALGPNNDDGFDAAYYSRISDMGTNSDSDLDALVETDPDYNHNSDAAVLEFDVIATNSCVLEFQYVFTSEEYPEYIGRFNDPMAIFVSTNCVGGQWINTNNIALVPGTNQPVTVNTITGGGGIFNAPASNPQYYVDNPVNQGKFNIQYDGMTFRLTATVTISPNVTNHIKIAVEDYNDAVLDSAVFIKSGN